MPEEILLLGIGYIADVGNLNLYAAIFISIAGIMAADNMWYWLGRSHSSIAQKLIRGVGQEKIKIYENMLRKHTGKYVFLSRFIPGARAIGPILAGSIKINKSHFWLFNIVAGFLYAPIFILIGYYFNYNLEVLMSKVVSVRHIVFILFLSAVGLGTAYFVKKKLF